MDQYQQSQLPTNLDFCSATFDPSAALHSNVHLPFPNAKTYNNLAEYYSHTFLKKENFKRAEKDRPYDRDYSWYFSTLGLGRAAQNRYEERKQRKPKKYCGWRTAKMRKYFPKPDNDPNRIPCRGYAPLKSTKIIQPKTPLTKYKIIPLKTAPDSSDETVTDDHTKNITQSDEVLLLENLVTRNVEEPDKLKSVFQIKTGVTSSSVGVSKNLINFNNKQFIFSTLNEYCAVPPPDKRKVLNEISLNRFISKEKYKM